jgi:transposase
VLAMMGPRQMAQGALFYEFSIEDHVPADHLLRQIDRFVDLSEIRSFLAPFYSATGRPSVDPELMIRMLIVGYCFGIRSERRLCDEVHLNLAHRWFCRLDLSDAVPDHSAFSKNRHGRFRDSDLFRHLFERVLARCIAEGLVGGDGFGVDASLIKADASRYTKVEAKHWSIPETVTRATREYLASLDDAAFGAATPVQPKILSPADPAARFTGANGDRAFFAYSTNYLVDLENAVIVDVEGRIRQGRLQALLRPQTGLRGLSVEAPPHAKSADPEDLPLEARGCPPGGPRHRQDRRICRLELCAQESRDVVRAPQAHPRPRPTPPPRTKRRPRRIPPRSDGPEPAKARQAGPRTGVSRINHSKSATRSSAPSADFFNGISAKRILNCDC